MLVRCLGKEWESGEQGAQGSYTRQEAPYSYHRFPCARYRENSRTSFDPFALPYAAATESAARSPWSEDAYTSAGAPRYPSLMPSAARHVMRGPDAAPVSP